jgi:hypothetical protein
VTSNTSSGVGVTSKQLFEKSRVNIVCIDAINTRANTLTGYFNGCSTELRILIKVMANLRRKRALEEAKLRELKTGSSNRGLPKPASNHGMNYIGKHGAISL